MPGNTHLSLSVHPKLNSIWILTSNNSRYSVQLLKRFEQVIAQYPYNSYCPAFYKDDNVLFKIAEITRSTSSQHKYNLYNYVNSIKASLPYCFYEFIFALHNPILFSSKYVEQVIDMGERKNRLEQFLVAYYISEIAFIKSDKSLLKEMIDIMLSINLPMPLTTAMQMSLVLDMILHKRLSYNQGILCMTNDYPQYTDWINNTFAYLGDQKCLKNKSMMN